MKIACDICEKVIDADNVKNRKLVKSRSRLLEVEFLQRMFGQVLEFV